jgi:hypothetical protein
MNESKIVEEFTKTTSTYFSDRVDYDSVYALLVSWKDNDLAPDNEIAELRKVLESDYNFKAHGYSIASEGAQQGLNLEISSCVAQWSTKLNTLVIIYYAGHCFSSEKGETMWAAYAYLRNNLASQMVMILADIWKEDRHYRGPPASRIYLERSVTCF